MKKSKITLTTGETFPFEFTMGAMLIFHKETGREATEADLTKFSDLMTTLWAGTVAASEVAGTPCNYSLQEFANRLTPEGLSAWQREAFADDKPSKKKKKEKEEKETVPES